MVSINITTREKCGNPYLPPQGALGPSLDHRRGRGRFFCGMLAVLGAGQGTRFYGFSMCHRSFSLEAPTPDPQVAPPRREGHPLHSPSSTAPYPALVRTTMAAASSPRSVDDGRRKRRKKS